MATPSSTSAPYTPTSSNYEKNVRFTTPITSNPFQSSSTSSIFSSHSSSGLGGTLKSEIEEKQKLEKENFDLKLKIYHLEESLRQVSSGEMNSEVQDLQSEVTHLRHLLQENRMDLEHRNTLLIKAKGVIETLKEEILTLKGQVEEKSTREVHLSHKLQSVTHDRDSYDESLQHRIELLEEENNSLKQTLTERNESLHHCRIQINDLESTLNLTKITLAEVTTQKDGLHERCNSLKLKLDQLETELVELRTEKDMWGLQGTEYSEMVEILQSKHDELRHQLIHQSHDDERRSSALVKKYEDQLAQMKSVYEQEFNNLKEKYQTTLAEVRDQMRAAHQEELHELKSQGYGENYRMKEELLTRIHEKAEEVISLRGVVEMERSRVESLTKELFIAREELKVTSQNLAQKDKKLSDLESNSSSSQQNALKTSELLTKTTEECKVLQYQLQEKNHQLEQIRQDYKDYEIKYTGILKDFHTLQSEYEYSKSLTGNLQNTYRENERYVHQIQQMKSDYDLLASQDHAKDKEISLLSTELDKKEKIVDDLNVEKKELAQKYERLLGELQEKEHELRHEKDQHLQLESALLEHRNITVSLQRELDNLRSMTQRDDLKWNQNENILKNQKNEIEKVCGILFQAVTRWDQVLSGALDTLDGPNSFPHAPTPVDGRGYFRNSAFSSHGFGHTPSPSPETFEDLLSSSLIIIERVQGKLERVEKIRNLFEKKTKEMMSAITLRVSHSDDRMEILSHKTSALQTQLQSVLTQVLNEKKIRDQGHQELKALQESLVRGHNEQIREHEARVSELHLLYQAEKNKVTTLNHEVSVLGEEIKIQQEELGKLHEAEEMLNKLSVQLSSLSDSHRQLSHELEEKSNQVAQQLEDIQHLRHENESYQQNLTRLTSQIEVRDKMLNDHESLISSLKVEIQQLQRRQINPELEKSIRESQDLLKYSLGRAGADYSQPSSQTSSTHLSERKVDNNFTQIVDRLTSLYHSVTKLVDETSRAWKSFDDRYSLELGVRGELTFAQSNSRSTEIEQSIYDLLNSNAKLALQLQGVVSDFKRYLETSPPRLGLGESHHSTVLPSSDMPSLFTTPAPSRSLSQYPSTPLYSAVRDQPKLSANDLRIESHPASPLHHSIPSAARKDIISSRIPHETPHSEHSRVHFQVPEARSRSLRPSSLSSLDRDRQGERYNSSRGTSLTNRSTQHTNLAEDGGWITRSKLLFDATDSSPSTPPMYPRSSRPHESSSSTMTSSSRRTLHLFPSDPSSAVAASSSSSPTPARQSASRLTKLGQDLQNLANRLDHFDVKSRR